MTVPSIVPLLLTMFSLFPQEKQAVHDSTVHSPSTSYDVLPLVQCSPWCHLPVLTRLDHFWGKKKYIFFRNKGAIKIDCNITLDRKFLTIKKTFPLIVFRKKMCSPWLSFEKTCSLPSLKKKTPYITPHFWFTLFLQYRKLGSLTQKEEKQKIGEKSFHTVKRVGVNPCAIQVLPK